MFIPDPDLDFFTLPYPGSGAFCAFLTPGFGMGKNPDPDAGWNKNPDPG
jgi:hypothetical protein